MLDDVIAGIFAFICMQLLYFYINGEHTAYLINHYYQLYEVAQLH
jgi:hypothetical protein